MPFRISGTLARPKTDLLDKLVGARIGQDLGGLINSFLRPIQGPSSFDFLSPDSSSSSVPVSARNRGERSAFFEPSSCIDSDAIRQMADGKGSRRSLSLVLCYFDFAS
jgi:hypothetical protein